VLPKDKADALPKRLRIGLKEIVRRLGRNATLQFVAQRVEIAAFESALLSLPLAGLHQMFQTPGAFGRGVSAFGTLLVSLHPQLVLPLPGYLHRCELVLN